MPVLSIFKEQLQFCSVKLEPIHLFMAQKKTADHLVRAKKFAAECP